MPEQPVEIRLIIPGAPEFLRLARLAAADAGSRAGLTYDEIEDLRIGVDELCYSVMRADGSGVVALAFQPLPEGIAVEGEGPRLDPDRNAKPSELSRTIIAAVVDDHDLSRDGDKLRFRLFKRAQHR
jgi:anti-sigma regulatory factor (Ser/Thr protein kinase)